jgi:hypothetical protein
VPARSTRDSTSVAVKRDTTPGALSLPWSPAERGLSDYRKSKLSDDPQLSASTSSEDADQRRGLISRSPDAARVTLPKLSDSEKQAMEALCAKK